MSAFGSGQPSAAPPAALAYAGFWVRFVAYVIDVVILSVLNGVLFGALWSSMIDSSGPEPVVHSGPMATYSVLSLLIPAVYTVGFWASGGATPGKMALSLRVVRSQDGGPLSLGRAIGRFLGYFVSSFVFALGFIWVAFDARKQGWHDKLASTVVVRRVGPPAAVFRA